MNRRLRLLAPLTLAATACISTEAVVLGDADFPARAPDHRIPFFDELGDIGLRYVKVARIYVDASDSVSMQTIAEAIRAKARAVGADAVVLGPSGRVVRGRDGEGRVCFDRVGSALAVRFVDR